MADLKYSDKVVCVNTFGYSLTKGNKYYIIERESDKVVMVKDTKGNLLEDVHCDCFEKIARNFNEGDSVVVTSDDCPICGSNEKLEGVQVIEHHDKHGSMLPYLINGNWYCDECLEAYTETRVYKWKVGDELIVVFNGSGGFDKGTKVIVNKVDTNDDDLTYRVGDDTDTYWHRETDLELIPVPKYIPLSEQVTVTFVDRVPCKNPAHFIVKDGWNIMTIKHEEVDCGSIANSAQKAVFTCLNKEDREVKIVSICKEGNVYTVAVQ